VRRLGLLLSALALSCATTGATRAPGQAVGAPLPPLVVQRFSGGELDLAATGGKVLLIDLWASWCTPCKEEMPLLDEMAARLRDRGVEIIAVSVDEERASAEAFLATRPRWTLTLAHDPRGRVPELLQPPKMPTSYIVDAAGVVRHINAGFEASDAAKIEARLVELARGR
jgi:thiol-disulfide isomerase/thioredoxin